MAGNNKTYVGLHLNCPVFCQILTKFGASRRILIVRGIKFCDNPSIGGRSDTCGQTDKHEEVNTPFLRLCERA